MAVTDVRETGRLLVPASPIQQRLWLAAAGDPTGAAYNVTCAVRLRGPVDHSSLQRALALIADRHEALRTTLTRRDGTLLQVIDERVDPLPFAFEEWPDAPDTAIDRLLSAEASAPFDLEAGPLFRARLIRTAAERHVLCLTLHHAICDGWSLEIVARELAVAYGSLVRAVTPAWPALPLQYADVSEWRREQGEGAAAPAAEYWSRLLADLPSPLPWPTDYSRPPDPSGRGARVSRVLPSALSTAVKSFARQHHTTPAVAWMALYALFMRRWTGATDFVLGTPASGRDAVELEAVVGPFVNTVTPRFSMRSDASFLDLLATTRQQMLDALAHQHVPLDLLLRRIMPGRGPASAPLFQAMFAWQPLPPLAMPGLDCTRLPVEYETSKVDLTLFVFDEGESTRLTFEYSCDLFREATMTDALAAFEQLARSAVAQPRVPGDRLGWITDEQRTRVLSSAQGPASAYARDASLAALFREQVRQRATSPAVIDGDLTLSYADLQREAEGLAAELVACGVAPGDRVAVVARGGVGLVVGVLGAVLAGAVYAPIDPGDPPARIAALLEDCGAVAMVATGAPRDTAWGIPVLDPLTRRIGEHPARIEIEPRAGDPVAFMYTSGSTGRPKAVVIPHRAIVRLVSRQDYVTFGPSDRVGLASNPAFDASLFEMWGALLNGATLVALDPDTLLSASRLREAIAGHALTVLFVTTALFNRVASSAPDTFARLRTVVFGGERAQPDALQRVLAAGPPERLVNGYGPTEGTTFSTWHLVRDVQPRRSVPIGRPLANTSAFVLDHQLALVPPGVVGELCIGGDGLALGYHRATLEQADRFVEHPDWGRLYRTGDRCRVNADGDIEFIERIDRQVKLRGFRIEPEEIERSLLAHPGVKQAAVDIVDDPGDRRLVAAVVSPSTSASELQAWIAGRLPGFMCPSAIAVLNELPLTPRGKLDWSEVGASLQHDASSRRARRAPRDPLEAELVSIWEEALGITPIGIDDDFFALGGHSLLAAQVVEQVERRFGTRLPLARLLTQPTIAGLASWLWDEREHAPMVVLREEGARPPLFFAHGDVNGGGLYCRRLVEQLPPDQPLYILGSSTDTASAPRSIEQLATAHRCHIEATYPRGPLVLGGYCHGALVAWELARQLRGHRDIVNVLLVYPSPVEPRLRVLARSVSGVARLTGLDDARRVELMVRLVMGLRFARDATLAQRWAWMRRKVSAALGRQLVAAHGAALQSTASMRHDPDAWERVIRAVIAYVPGRYDGPVTIVSGPGSEGALEAWQRAAPQAEVRITTGTHATCVTSELSSLAVELEAALQRAAPVRAQL